MEGVAYTVDVRQSIKGWYMCTVKLIRNKTEAIQGLKLSAW